MNRYTVLGLAVGLIVGIVIGYQAGSAITQTSPAAVAAAPAPAQQGGMPGGAPSGAGMEALQRIATAQQVVARDPKNHRAWVQLGNDYFDTNQPQKSIEAYGRALELQPDDPDVLTDQGVMYRAIGQFDRAVANFQRASQLDPKHVQSVFNMGVVYANDLRDPAQARKAWTRVVEIAPGSQQAANARQALEQLPPAGK